MAEIIDNVSYTDAMRALASNRYLMIVDRQLATRAFGNSGHVLTNIVFLPPIFIVGAVISVFFSWALSLACVGGAIISFRALRLVAIRWVRRMAVAEPSLYEVFARNHIIWFTPSQR